MAFSDAICGPTRRYVSQTRLEQMLEHEYCLLGERLAESRGAETGFFAFADTVAARSRRDALVEKCLAASRRPPPTPHHVSRCLRHPGHLVDMWVPGA